MQSEDYSSPRGNPREKALANPVKRAHGRFMHDNRAGSGPFAEAYRHDNAIAAERIDACTPRE
jgi:hypothetical protein